MTLKQSITIYAPATDAPLATVLVEEGSKAVATLMEQDYIELHFNTTHIVHFPVGAWCMIYSDKNMTPPKRYVVCQKTYPTFNEDTAGYEYRLRLDAWYYAWQRYTFCLTPKYGANTTDFFYTQKLPAHAELIFKQLINIIEDRHDTSIEVPSAIYIHYINKTEIYSWSNAESTTTFLADGETTEDIAPKFRRDGSAEDAEMNIIVPGGKIGALTLVNTIWYDTEIDPDTNEANYLVEDKVKSVQYQDINIIEAMKQMCSEEAFNCEWWFDDEQALHFGRCEYGTPVRIENATDGIITRQDSSSEYANSIIAFGSTRNVPARYRKSLIFECDTPGDPSVIDSTRKVNIKMFPSDLREEGGIVASGSSSYGYSGIDFEKEINITFIDTTVTGPCTALFDIKDFKFAINSFDVAENDPEYYAANIYEAFKDCTIAIKAGTETFMIKPESIDVSYFIVREEETYYDFHLTFYFKPQTFILYGTGSISLVVGAQGIKNTLYYLMRDHLGGNNWVEVRCTDALVRTRVEVLTGDQAGRTLPVTINPQRVISSNKQYNEIEGLGSLKKGDKFRYAEKTIIESEVPITYYTDDFSTDDNIASYTRRLMLPTEQCRNNIIEVPGTTPESRVEIVKVFEDIYPSETFEIAKVTQYSEQVPKIDDNGQTYYVPEERFRFYLRKQDIDFKQSYISGGELQCQFQDGKLAGLTFGLAFEGDTNVKDEQGNALQAYVIVPDKNYNILLPNVTLEPRNGDHIVLLNYSPAAISDIGLIDSAEERLYNRAKSYLEKVSLETGTYTAKIYFEKAKQMFDSPEGLPTIGQKTELIHPAYFGEGGTRITRVVGYEKPLDIPWDNPTFTIGESPAYSHFAAIDKQLKSK